MAGQPGLILKDRRVTACAAFREEATIDSDAKKMMRSAGMTSAVGLEIAGELWVGFYGGPWLDERFGTAPFFKWFLGIAGVGAVIKTLMRVTKEYKRQLAHEEHQEEGAAARGGDPAEKPKPDEPPPS